MKEVETIWIRNLSTGDLFSCHVDRFAEAVRSLVASYELS